MELGQARGFFRDVVVETLSEDFGAMSSVIAGEAGDEMSAGIFELHLREAEQLGLRIARG